jgi:hypothetical protein
MAKETTNLLWQAARTVLVTLQMADIDDNELHDLILRIGHTGKR